MVYYRLFNLIKKIFPYAALCLLFLFLLSCGLKKPAAIHHDVSPADLAPPSLGRFDRDDLLSALAKIDFISPDGYYPAKVALMIKRPSYIRLELLSIIGGTDFLLTATPEAMNIFIPSRGEIYSGKPTRSNLKKFLPWSLDIEDMVMILTGTFPVLKEQDIIYQGLKEANYHRWEMKAPSGVSQIIWVGDNHQLSQLVRKDATGEELYHVKYVYADAITDFPEKIIITMGDGNTSLSIKYADVKIEKSADLSAFNPVIPDDVKSMTLE